MTDNLESFFKKHILNEPYGKDDWDIPSDHVWDSILTEIQKTGGVFISWKYLYILGTVFIAAFIIGFLNWKTQNTPTSINPEKYIVNKEIKSGYFKQEAEPIISAKSNDIDNAYIDGVDDKTRNINEVRQTAELVINKTEKDVSSTEKMEFIITEPASGIKGKRTLDGTSIKRFSDKFEKPILMKIIPLQSITYLSGSIKKHTPVKSREVSFRFNSSNGHIIRNGENDKTSPVNMPNFVW